MSMGILSSSYFIGSTESKYSLFSPGVELKITISLNTRTNVLIHSAIFPLENVENLEL